MRRYLAFVMALLVILLVATQLILPPTVGKSIKRALSASLESAEHIDVKVATFPAGKMLFGDVEKLEVDLIDFRLHGLKIDAFRLVGHHVKLDRADLMRGRGIVVKKADALEATLVISEASINEYLWAELDPDKQFRVQLTEAGAHVLGQIGILGRDYSTSMHGHFRIEDGTRLVFYPDDLRVEGATLPSFVVDLVKQQWNIELDFSEAPVPIQLKGFKVENQTLIIFGQGL